MVEKFIDVLKNGIVSIPILLLNNYVNYKSIAPLHTKHSPSMAYINCTRQLTAFLIKYPSVELNNIH